MYNFVFVVMLYFFLLNFMLLKMLVVMTILFNTNFYNAFLIGCFVYVLYVFFSLFVMLGLLGVSLVFEFCDSKYFNLVVGMDVITWMGVTTWRFGGVFVFVLFIGLFIILCEFMLGDCIMRCVVVVYLC